ncbi:MAG: hypothetical protein WKF37_14225 [Bryobacteraceae bacterium]
MLPHDAGKHDIAIRWSHLSLEPGTYFIEVGAYEKNWAYAYDFHSRCYPVIVRKQAATMVQASTQYTQPVPEWFVSSRSRA